MGGFMGGLGGDLGYWAVEDSLNLGADLRGLDNRLGGLGYCI